MVAPPEANSEKNIWIAASEGDLDRVKYLIEVQGLSPSVADENSYTPLHAAASWGHVDLIKYLIQEKGGNANTVDEDGETPLYVVESKEMAQVLLDLGASPAWTNKDGESPAQRLLEEFPEIAHFLADITKEKLEEQEEQDESADQQEPENQRQEGQDQLQEQAGSNRMALDENVADNLVERAQEIMERAQAEGRDPDEELRQIANDAIQEQFADAFRRAQEGDSSEKRPRTE